MSTRHVIFLESAGVRIAAIDDRGVRWLNGSFDASASPADQAATIASSLRGSEYRGDPVLLALPSIMCLPAQISLKGLAARDRQAMLYRLEEALPLAAEDFVADFVVRDDSAFGVAVPLQPLRALVDALEAQGAAIASITPAALLAVDDLSDGVRLIREDGMTNELRFEHGGLSQWKLLSGVEWHADITELDDAAARRGAEILSGSRRPIIEFRRDALARSDRFASYRAPVNALLASAAVLMLLLAGAALVRAHRYNRAADRIDATLMSEFQTVFPGWQTQNIPAVVESEHRKLAATEASTLPMQARGSALRTLRDVIAAFPRTSAISVDRLSFEDASFELSGSAASLQDVETLSRATRVDGMNVAPPQSRRDEDGKWSFTIHGEKLPATASARREAP